MHYLLFDTSSFLNRVCHIWMSSLLLLICTPGLTTRTHWNLCSPCFDLWTWNYEILASTLVYKNICMTVAMMLLLLINVQSNVAILCTGLLTGWNRKGHKVHWLNMKLPFVPVDIHQTMKCLWEWLLVLMLFTLHKVPTFYLLFTKHRCMVVFKSRSVSLILICTFRRTNLIESIHHAIWVRLRRGLSTLSKGPTSGVGCMGGIYGEHHSTRHPPREECSRSVETAK